MAEDTYNITNKDLDATMREIEDEVMNKCVSVEDFNVTVREIKDRLESLEEDRSISNIDKSMEESTKKLLASKPIQEQRTLKNMTPQDATLIELSSKIGGKKTKRRRQKKTTRRRFRSRKTKK